jgi:hypothetical protein
MRDWLTDALKCGWALIYWNARKTVYVWRGRKSACPCQNPSDIGSSAGVRCEASLHLSEPLRFRRVCPLVVSGSTGRAAYCSVSAERVRPFWGRALAIFGAGLLACYLVAATTVYVGLRTTGLRTLSWGQVAWPGSWDEIPRERSAYFFQQALAACARRDYGLAYRSMVAAVAQDRANYPARLFAAQYATYAGEVLTSDDLFEMVLEEFDDQRTRTAVTWHDTLLAVGRFDKLAGHCLRMAAEDTEHRSIWVGSLTQAMHLGRLGSGFCAENAAAIAALGPDAAPLVRAAAAVSDGNGEGALAALRYVFPEGADGNYVIGQIRWLLLIGAPANAETAWTINGKALRTFDRLLARSWIDAGLGYRALATLEFSALVDAAATPDDWDKLAATLVMQPDSEAFLSLHRRAMREAESLTAEQTASLWVAALAVGAAEPRAQWLRHARERFHAAYPAITEIDFKTVSPDVKGSVPFLTGVLPLARATITGLYGRVEPPPRPVPKRGARP